MAHEILDLRRLYSSSSNYDHLRFSGVFDAGSTGTRFNVYGFNNHNKIEFYYLEVTEPGISALMPRQIEKNIRILLESAKNKLSSIGLKINKIPMAFYATAGLRLIPEHESNNIINSVKKALKNYNVKMSDIRVITGSQEGTLALRSLLILKKFESWAVKKFGCSNLIKDPKLEIDEKYCKEIEEHLSHRHSYGIIDMGGGSVQVAYLNRMANKLISQSFLGLGLHESLNRIKNHPAYKTCRNAETSKSPLCEPVFKGLFGEAFRSRKIGDVVNSDEIFLVSFFYEKFFTAGSSHKKSLIEIKKDFARKCFSLDREECLEAGFLILLLEYFNFNDNTSFFLIRKILGVNINWSLAKAKDLIEEEKSFKMQQLEKSEILNYN